jgi:hypothetical protein
VAYHSETLSDIVRKYPTYDKEMYSIVQACHQWKHYILGKETIIHIDHKPSAVHTDTGEIVERTAIRSGPPTCNSSISTSSIRHGAQIVSLTTSVDLSWLHSPLCSIPVDMRHLSGPKFINKILTSPPPIISWVHVNVTDFHIQEKLLCHLDHLCVPTSEREKMIWESHYSRMAGHFGVEKTMVILQKHFYWPKIRQDVSKYIRSCTTCAIAKPTIKKQGLYTPLPTLEKPWESISMDYILAFCPPSKEMIVYLWSLIDFRRWPSSQPARRISQW